MAKIVQFQVVTVGESTANVPGGPMNPTATGTKTSIKTQLYVLDEEGRVWCQDQHGKMKPVISEVPDTF
jgi:hypothetical protein